VKKLKVTLALLVVAILGIAIGMRLWPPLGGRIEGARLERVQQSPQWHDGEFRNRVPTRTMAPGTFGKTLRMQFFGDEVRTPPAAIPVQYPSLAPSAGPGLRAVWVGHSSAILDIDGYRVLTDPIWSERCSPFQSIGPRRFHPPPLPLEETGRVDAVVISHDHYDHLDMDTVRTLSARGATFFVPLGVGAHLERWGVPAAQRKELDWNESARLGLLDIVALPSRHFSGRRGVDAYETLWATWAIIGPSHRVFFSGDTGWFDAFAEIGSTLGPFDLTVIKIGAYGPTWPDIHVNPEQAVAMHLAVRGKLMLPVHWGTFNLAYHDWNEPPERLIRAATGRIAFVLPRPGDVVDVRNPQPVTKWW
jgi:L-ascorbate metabolism protein UlaG (beta-lactamase superfamily)